ncbi:SecDF P1 head subdomain-containing protein [Undibacterium sp. Tian12W]|uniref:SecDF P1 head subdomain-containing protein n=1 Tax=Undibacterium sp. Tian12W TaxID=3413054 RepID=UPI003BF16AF8
MKSRLLICLASSLLFACTAFVGEPATIYLEAAVPLSKRDESIMLERLKEMSASNFVVSDEPGRKVIKANGVPPDAELAFLLQHRGQFKVSSEAGKLWFSNEDIVDAVAAFDEKSQPVLRLKLNDAATARVAGLSQAGTDHILIVLFDTKVLAQARLTSAITNGMLSLTANSTPKEASLISVILRYGALENAATSVATKRPQ